MTLAESLLDQRLGAQRVDVSRVFDHAGVTQLVDGLFSEALDVHTASRGEMDDALIALIRALELDATSVCLTFSLHQRRAQFARADARKLPRLRVARTFGQHGSDHFGDDVASFAHDHGVTGSHVFELHLFAVVQGRHAHRASCDDDRFKFGKRRRSPCATYRHLDVAQQRRALFGWKLDRHRPARCFGSEPKSLTLGEIVNFHHDTVNDVGQVVAMQLPVCAELENCIERINDAHFWIHRKAQCAQIVEGLMMRRELRSSIDVTQLVNPQRQLASCGDCRIFLTQTSGTGIAWIRRNRQRLFVFCNANFIFLHLLHSKSLERWL